MMIAGITAFILKRPYISLSLSKITGQASAPAQTRATTGGLPPPQMAVNRIKAQTAILNLAQMSLKYHKIMISANVISTGYGILESIKIHIENC